MSGFRFPPRSGFRKGNSVPYRAVAAYLRFRTEYLIGYDKTCQCSFACVTFRDAVPADPVGSRPRPILQRIVFTGSPPDPLGKITFTGTVFKHVHEYRRKMILYINNI